MSYEFFCWNDVHLNKIKMILLLTNFSTHLHSGRGTYNLQKGSCPLPLYLLNSDNLSRDCVFNYLLCTDPIHFMDAAAEF